MLFAVASLTIFMSCSPSSDDDTPNPDDNTGGTAGEAVITALTGSWSLDASSDVSAVTGAPDITGLTVTFTASGSTVSFALSGSDVATYISGGSFDVSDAGAISNVTATAQASQTDITVSSATASMNSDNTKVTITITVGEAAARTTGIGTYTLVFAKA